MAYAAQSRSNTLKAAIDEYPQDLWRFENRYLKFLAGDETLKRTIYLGLFFIVALAGCAGGAGSSATTSTEAPTTTTTSTPVTTYAPKSSALCARDFELWKEKPLSDKQGFLLGWQFTTTDCTRAEWIREATAIVDYNNGPVKLPANYYLRYALSGSGGKTAEQYLNEQCESANRMDLLAGGYVLGKACDG